MEAGRSINNSLQTSTSYPATDFTRSNYSDGAGSRNVSSAMGVSTVNPESPFLGLVRSHNTTQASMSATLKLCRVADTATELGYHDVVTGETTDKTQVYAPSMMIGSVNMSPLTMASIFTVYASNGVQCNPIAIGKVTNRDGNDPKAPSTDCHQAVDKGIIQALAYTPSQGTMRPDGVGRSFRLADGRKSFGKTGTSEDLAVSGGSFIPNQIAAFAVVGDAQNPYTNRISNITINGRYNSYWDGSTIAAPAVTNFFNSYISKKKIPIDNDYGQPVSKYTTTGKYLGIGGRTFSVPQTTTNGNSQSQSSNNQSQSQNTGQNNTQTQGTNSEQSNGGQ